MEESIIEEEEKKPFAFPSPFTILLALIVGVALLTWVIPSGQYDVGADGNIIAGTYHTVEQTPQGLWEIIAAPIIGMLGNEATAGAIEIAFYELVIGGFLSVVAKTGALEVGLARVMKANEHSIARLVWILMFLLVVGGSTFGLGEEALPFYPLLIPVVVSLGYDRVTALSIIYLGSNLGQLASTLNPFATGAASDAAGVSIGDGIGLRIVMALVMWVIGSLFILRYIKRIERNPEHSLVYGDWDTDREKYAIKDTNVTMTKKQKGVLVLFGLTFAVMIISLIPWHDFGVTLFRDLHETLTNTPVLGPILGRGTLALGDWTLVEITMLFFLMTIVVGIYAGLSESEIVDNFIAGARDMLSVALIVAVARGLQVIMNDGQITATVLHVGEESLSGLSKGVFVVIASIVYVPLAFLIPSTSGLAVATMGVMAPLAEFAGINRGLMITIYQTVAGLVNTVSPANAVLVGGLALSDVDIATWLKFIWKFLLLIAVVSVGLIAVWAYL